MSYIYSIKTAIFIFPIVAFLFTVPFMLYNYHKYGSIEPFKTIIVYTFILYLITVYFLVIMPLPKVEDVLKNTGPYFNFIPFSFVIEFIKETSLVITDFSTYLKALKEPCVYVVLFNIIMTMPFGMYLRYYFKCSFKKTILLTFLLSLFFEITQATGLYFIYPNPYRLCDVDDLILNTFGGILGYLLIGCFIKILPSRDELDAKAREVGLKISGLRRLTMFILDIIIYVTISTILTFIFDNHYLFYYVFIFYYLLIPILKKQTPAMKFLNIKIKDTKNFIIKIILRNIFLGLYYFYLPVGLFFLTELIINHFNLINIKVILHLLAFLTILLFYFINTMILLIKKKMYYDSLFNIELESTIELNNDSLLE